jgi:RecA/RadA recombinase
MNMGIADKIMKRLDSEGIMRFSEKEPFSKTDCFVHTGSPELDYNLGLLGFPVGITEISGESKSGKTTLALHGMKTFQKQHPDGLCVILSSENRDNKLYAEKIGVNTEEVIIIKSRFVDDLFLKFQSFINHTEDVWKEEKLEGKPKIYCFWDSIGATLARADYETFQANVKISEKNAEKNTNTEYRHAKMADFAKSAKNSVKNILAQLYDKDIVFVALNHLSADFNTGGTSSPGGRWVQFLPTLRLKTIRTSWEKIDEEEVAQKTKVKVEKNDWGSRRSTEIEILLGYGIVLSDNDIQYAVEKGILKKEGEKKRSFQNGKLTWNSKRTFYQNYIDGHKFLLVLHKMIMKLRHEDVLREKGLL